MPSGQTTRSFRSLSGYRASVERVNPCLFYKRLIKSVKTARDSLCLIYLPPEELPYREFAMYLTEVNKLIASDKLWIRRMVVVNDLPKMELVIADLGKFPHKQRFDVALIHPSCVVRDEERMYPLPANVQIIDDDVVYLVDPVHGYHQKNEDKSTSLIICSKDYAEVMKSYYDEWWKKCETLNDLRGVNKDPLYRLLIDLRTDTNGDECDRLRALLNEL